MTELKQPFETTVLRVLAALLGLSFVYFGVVSAFAVWGWPLGVAFMLCGVGYGVATLWLLFLTARRRIQARSLASLGRWVVGVNVAFPLVLIVTSLDGGSIVGLEWAGLLPLLAICGLIYLAETRNLKWAARVD